MNSPDQTSSTLTPAVEVSSNQSDTTGNNQNDTIYNNSASPANKAAGNNADASTANLADNTYMSAALPPNAAGNESAALTPEQLQAEIDRLSALMSSTSDGASASVGNVTDTVNDARADTPVPGQDTANLADNTFSSAASIPAYIVEFRQAFATANANQSFLDDRKKVEKVTAALKMPNPEDRVRAQLLVHTEKTMYADAAKRAEKGEPFVLPTKAQINAKVEEGVIAWRSKQN